MKIAKIHLVYFSPTGTTRATVRNIARGLRGEQVIEHDWTLPAGRETELTVPENDLVVFGMPVYGGRIPSPFHGGLPSVGSALAVSVVVYGNRDYDDALIELVNQCEEAGFHTLAAGAFVARHSLNPRMGTGRPDADDARREILFGENIMRKIEGLESVRMLERIEVKGNVPYREFKPMPLAPDLNSKRCIACGKCAAGCPVQVISPLTFRLVEPKKCIFCNRCVVSCPKQARGLSFIENTLFQAKMGKLEKMCRERCEPELFI